MFSDLAKKASAPGVVVMSALKIEGLYKRHSECDYHNRPRAGMISRICDCLEDALQGMESLELRFDFLKDVRRRFRREPDITA